MTTSIDMVHWCSDEARVGYAMGLFRGFDSVPFYGLSGFLEGWHLKLIGVLIPDAFLCVAYDSDERCVFSSLDSLVKQAQVIGFKFCGISFRELEF